MATQIISRPPVVVTSIAEGIALLALLPLFMGLGTAYRHIECNKDGCHRLGRFRHGPLRLCHVHHPDVPDDGRVTDEHIKQLRQTSERPA